MLNTCMKRLYVVCSGPSLNGFDFEQLRGEYVIAMNDNFIYVPEVYKYVALDSKHWENMYEELKKNDFPKYSVKGYDPSKWKRKLGAIEMKNTGVNGVEYGDGIRHGFNTGYTALNMAVKECDDVRVLGMDLGTKGHFFDPDFEWDFEYVIKHLAVFKEELRPETKVTFYGPTRQSVFPVKPLEDACK